MEDNFWDLSPTPLPKMILTTSPYPSIILEIQSQEQCDTTNENGNPSHIVPNITISETGGESLQSGQENPILSLWFILGKDTIKRVKVCLFLLEMINLNLQELDLQIS
ncbi:hypothetical protein TorRG33x02_003940 [Trema orientale]|uniref:Uncharacterized protein n=1 Tax=Trema orientale TaxID=63057 RepID=A0A2P5G215_TREOI|nr:hypothetical protein TorRG33x02_003940 [Trema orientale]